MFAFTRKAQYHETDRMGVIHHANYVKWLEEARIEWMDRLGLSYRAVEDAGVVSPVVELNLRYRRPMTFGDTATVELRAVRYTGVVLELAYTVRTADGETALEATSKHCFLKNGRPVSLKKELPAVHAALSEERNRDNEGEERI